MFKTLVSNTGPLVALSAINHLPLLRDLFLSIHVAEQVRQEITFTSQKPAALLFKENPWIIIHDNPTMPDNWLAHSLDAGEAMTIALTMNLKADAILIDERKGRRIARNIYQLPVLGSAGILLRAKKENLISAVGPLLLEIRNSGYYMNDTFIQMVINEANE